MYYSDTSFNSCRRSITADAKLNMVLLTYHNKSIE